jgi:chaperonin GroES
MLLLQKNQRSKLTIMANTTEQKQSEEKISDYTDYIECLENRVVIRGATPAEKTAGGIIIPDSAKQRPEQGVVVAMGPGPGAAPDGKMTVNIGDNVLFSKFAGIDIEIEGEKLLLMREGDIFCILKKKVCLQVVE